MNKRAVSVIALVFFIFAARNLYAGTETIVPLDTVKTDTPNLWPTNKLAGKVSAVTDNDDAFYVYTTSGGSSLQFKLTDETTIPADATVDSFVIVLRAQKTTADLTRIKNRLRMDGNSNFCDGSNITLSTSWSDHSQKFTLTPTGGASCAGGTLSKDRIDSLNVQIFATTIPSGGEARVSEVDVVVYFTAAGSDVSTGRRRRINLMSAKFIEEKPVWLWSKDNEQISI